MILFMHYLHTILEGRWRRSQEWKWKWKSEFRESKMVASGEKTNKKLG